MGDPWELRGHALNARDPRKSHGNPMGVTWENPKRTEDTRMSHGNPMGDP